MRHVPTEMYRHDGGGARRLRTSFVQYGEIWSLKKKKTRCDAPQSVFKCLKGPVLLLWIDTSSENIISPGQLVFFLGSFLSLAFAFALAFALSRILLLLLV